MIDVDVDDREIQKPENSSVFKYLFNPSPQFVSPRQANWCAFVLFLVAAFDQAG